MAIDDDEVQRYFDDGLLIVEDLFTKSELQPVLDAIEGIVDETAERLHAAGRIADKHADKGLYTRMTALESDYSGAALLVHLRGIMEPAIADLWSGERLLGIVERLMGPDIAGYPVWNIHPKTPHPKVALNPHTKTPVGNFMSTPWHQDSAFYTEDGTERLFTVAAWIPLLDIRMENGPLQVVRGGHRAGLLQHHLAAKHGDEGSFHLFIEEDDLPEAEIVTCEVNMGTVVFFYQITPHRGLENTSDKVRWTLDLRWRQPGLYQGHEERPPVTMRRSDDPAFRPDMAAWMAADRARFAEYVGRTDGDEFDTTVTGEWMERWS